MNAARSVLGTRAFWLLFCVSTLGGTTNSAIAPAIPNYVENVIDGTLQFSGLLISIAPLTAILATPLGGFLADRFGYRLIASLSALISSASLLIFVFAPFSWSIIGSRVLFGFGNAVLLILSMTWLIAITPAMVRGKALGVYGLSVWISLALGPQLTTMITDVAGPSVVFFVCAISELIVAILFLLLPQPVSAKPRIDSPVRKQGILWIWEVLRHISLPGVAAAAAWSAQGLMLGFLVIHLTGAGLPATGLFGAATIFGVFAASVIVARIALAGMPDRLGSKRTAIISFFVLSTGLAGLAFSSSFATAATSAAIMGVGFSPLYPALVMLATQRLQTDNRAFGLGLFGSFTSIGFAAGALLGGFVLAVAPSAWAFLVISGLQLVALALIAICAPPVPRRGQ